MSTINYLSLTREELSAQLELERNMKIASDEAIFNGKILFIGESSASPIIEEGLICAKAPSPSIYDELHHTKYRSPADMDGVYIKEDISSLNVERIWDSKSCSADAKLRKESKTLKRKSEWTSILEKTGLTQAQLTSLSGMLIYNPLTYGLNTEGVKYVYNYLSKTIGSYKHKVFINKLFKHLTSVNSKMKAEGVIRLRSYIYPCLSKNDVLAIANTLVKSNDDIIIDGETYPLESRASGKEDPLGFLESYKNGRELSYTNKISIIEMNRVSISIPYTEEIETKDSTPRDSGNYIPSTGYHLQIQESIDSIVEYLTSKYGGINLDQSNLGDEDRSIYLDLKAFRRMQFDNSDKASLNELALISELEVKQFQMENCSTSDLIPHFNSSSVLGVHTIGTFRSFSFSRGVIVEALNKGVKRFILQDNNKIAKSYLISQGAKEVLPLCFRIA